MKWTMLAVLFVELVASAPLTTEEPQSGAITKRTGSDEATEFQPDAFFKVKRGEGETEFQPDAFFKVKRDEEDTEFQPDAFFKA